MWSSSLTALLQASLYKVQISTSHATTIFVLSETLPKVVHHGKYSYFRFLGKPHHSISETIKRQFQPMSLTSRPNSTPLSSPEPKSLSPITNTSDIPSSRSRRRFRLALHLQPHLHPPRQILIHLKLCISEEAPHTKSNKNNGQDKDDCYDHVGKHRSDKVV